MKHKKTGIFTFSGPGMVSKLLSYFDEMESKMLFFTKNFLHSGRKILRRFGNTGHINKQRRSVNK
jgi:hypothetical protein